MFLTPFLRPALAYGVHHKNRSIRPRIPYAVRAVDRGWIYSEGQDCCCPATSR